MYSISFTEHNKNFCLSLHYNGANSYLFANGTEIHKFKLKVSEIVAILLCLGNISKNWSVDNMKKKIIDYDDIADVDILNFHIYLMKKNDIA